MPMRLRRSAQRLYVDLSLCGLLFFMGCTGDFGRMRPSLVTEDVQAWLGRDAAVAYSAPVSLYPLTDEERLLRDYAYPLIEPAYDRNRWYSVLGEFAVTRVFNPVWYFCDPTAYAARLMAAPVRSETTRYSRLNEDIRNDVVRIDPFFMVARRVLDMDRKREKSLSYVPVLSGAEIANAQSRIDENLLVVSWVQRALADRAASYRFALERLVVAVPSDMAAEVARSLTLLERRSAENAVVAPLEFAGGVGAIPLPRPRVAVSR